MEERKKYIPQSFVQNSKLNVVVMQQKSIE